MFSRTDKCDGTFGGCNAVMERGRKGEGGGGGGGRKGERGGRENGQWKKEERSEGEKRSGKSDQI